MSTYFSLKNKNLFLHNLLGKKAEYKPYNREFTPEINALITKIEKSLLERNFNVPEVFVEFTLDHETGDVKPCRIEAFDKDIRIFSSFSIGVKGFDLCTFSKNSGTLRVYNGSTWEEDKYEFINKSVNRKLRGLKNILFEYTSDHGTVFNAYDDINRNYMPEGNQKSFYHLSEINDKFTAELTKLLVHIELFPTQKIDNTLFLEPKPEKIKWTHFKDVKLIARVSDYLVENHVVKPSTRLLSLGNERPKDHKYYDIMNEGFTYFESYKKDEEPYSGNFFSSDKAVEAQLENAHGVFVIDEDAFEAPKKEWFENNKSETYLTDKQVDEFLVMKASTIVPINEYDGSFKTPIVIVNRNIGKNELIRVFKPESQFKKVK